MFTLKRIVSEMRLVHLSLEVRDGIIPHIKNKGKYCKLAFIHYTKYTKDQECSVRQGLGAKKSENSRVGQQFKRSKTNITVVQRFLSRFHRKLQLTTTN